MLLMLSSLQTSISNVTWLRESAWEYLASRHQGLFIWGVKGTPFNTNTLLISSKIWSGGLDEQVEAVKAVRMVRGACWIAGDDDEDEEVWPP
jgi:hypothetical protein